MIEYLSIVMTVNPNDQSSTIDHENDDRVGFKIFYIY